MSSQVPAVQAANDWALPLFLTRENKYSVGFTMFGFAGLIYLAANHVHLTPPILLPMNWIDNAVPFMPNSVWAYLSEYFFFTAIYVCFRDMVNANKFIYSFFALQVLSCSIFWMWPTTYPRDLFPLPEDLNALTYYVFHSLREADTPANCCPSLHVSSVYLCSFIYLDEQREKFPLFFFWATVIAASTLTTKQHYLVDVVTGFLMAVILYWVFHRLIPYRQAKR